MSEVHGSDHGPLRARGPVTGAERARVAELHAQGLTRAAIARELGRGAATVGRIAEAAGLSFDGSKTAAATARKQLDNRARRSVLVEQAYEGAMAVLSRLAAEDGYDATGTATTGKTVVTRVNVPPAHDVKALAGAFAQLTGSAARMEALDTDSGAEAAKSMLGNLGAALHLAAGQLGEAGDERS
jgi:hypothetical protein